jgi:hypothetical protein
MRAGWRAFFVVAILVSSFASLPRSLASPSIALAATCPAFSALPAQATAGIAEDVAVGLFNHDAYLDVAVANFALNLNKVSSFLNDGTGGLIVRQDSPAGSPPSSLGQNGIAVGDFDEDGRLDLAVVKLWEAKLTVIVGDPQTGAGTFRAHASFDTGTFPFDVAASDFDGDGHLDAAVANWGADSVSVFFGDGTGSFAAPVVVAVGAAPASLAVGDLDLDGSSEIVVTHAAGAGQSPPPAGVRVLYRTGARSFGTVDVPIPGSHPTAVTVAPMNADLFPDLVVADGVHPNVYVAVSQGKPARVSQFAVGAAIATGSSYAAAIGGAVTGDLDGDGKVDVAVAVSNGQFLLPTGEPAVRALRGDGSGGLTQSGSVMLGREPKAIELADLNRDGALDILMADGSDGVYVARNTCAPTVALDLAATGIELVQVIQDAANGVPLIEGKRTIVRAYATATRIVDGVTARLARLDASGNEVGSVLPINPLGRISLRANPSREFGAQSFQFDIPEAWTHGTLNLRLEVNSGGALPDTNAANNATTATVSFVPARKLKVTLVDYRWQQCVDTNAVGTECKPGAASVGYTNPFPTDEYARIESLLRRKLPVALVDVKRIEVKDNGTILPKNLSIIPGAVELNRVITLRQSLQSADPGRIFIWLNRSFQGGAAYLPHVLYPERRWDAVAGASDAPVHEIGHLLGSLHTNCDGTEKDPDPAYPYVSGKIGGPASDPQKYMGYAVPDATPMTVEFGSVVPPTVGDEMGYCQPRWPSDYTYRKWRADIETRPGFVDPTGDFLVVAGTVASDGSSATLDTVARLSQVATLSSAQPGAYRIRLFDASGSTITDHAVTAGRILSHHDEPTLAFNEVFNWVPGTRRVALIDSAGTQLAARDVSANSPVVGAVTQSGGATLPASGTITVSWSASDADGDALTASVAYSVDDGASWTALATGVTGTSFAIDAAQLSGTKGSATGRFRMIVSDGALTSAANTSAFTAPGHAPTVRIATPLAGTRLELGQSVVLEAVALDAEDGVLDGASVAWSSSFDGPLGTGRLSAARLTEGLHTITATATDGDGQSVSATRSVRIARNTAAGSAPSANAGADAMTSEGATVTLNGAASSDADGDALTYSWTVIGAPVDDVELHDATTPTPSFLAVDDGTYSFRLTVSDGLNAPISDDVVVTVGNVAPVVTVTAPTPGQLFATGPVSVHASFADPGGRDEHTCLVTWDIDQPTLVGSGTVDHVARTCVATRSLVAGVYTIAVSVDDGDGGVGTAQIQVVVYDPTAGFVTGGGWIQSPAGASSADASAAGRASFGFELRYRNGAAVPNGQTEFNFKVGGIDFHSIAYDWLVVAGAKAQFRGSGTVNGEGGYSFLVTVIDGKASGGASAFRIKIWNAAGVVYDNVPTAADDLDRAEPAPLGGGNIVVHP